MSSRAAASFADFVSEWQVRGVGIFCLVVQRGFAFEAFFDCSERPIGDVRASGIVARLFPVNYAWVRSKRVRFGQKGARREVGVLASRGQRQS